MVRAQKKRPFLLPLHRCWKLQKKNVSFCSKNPRFPLGIPPKISCPRCGLRPSPACAPECGSPPSAPPAGSAIKPERFWHFARIENENPLVMLRLQEAGAATLTVRKGVKLMGALSNGSARKPGCMLLFHLHCRGPEISFVNLIFWDLQGSTNLLSKISQKFLAETSMYLCIYVIKSQSEWLKVLT